MTILTKHTISIKKIPLIPEISPEDEIIDIHPATSAPGWKPRRRTSTVLLCMSITALAVAITGLTSGVMLYRQYLRTSVVHRFQGFCTIPIGHRQIQMEASEKPDILMMPLRWSVSSDAIKDADDNDDDVSVQVFSNLEEIAPDDLRNTIREELEIDNSTEKIVVIENGRHINFIHDFIANITGIADSDRCFTMELDSEVALAPSVFALALSRGGSFDVTRVRSSLRAALPALDGAARLARLVRDALLACQDKPVYQLMADVPVGVPKLFQVQYERIPIIHKRSVDEPPHQYIQFAGKHVQEIAINNLADIIDYENNNINNKNNTA